MTEDDPAEQDDPQLSWPQILRRRQALRPPLLHASSVIPPANITKYPALLASWKGA
jgi:hypothetical protein